jgi:hypothetical protein
MLMRVYAQQQKQAAAELKKKRIGVRGGRQGETAVGYQLD